MYVFKGEQRTLRGKDRKKRGRKDFEPMLSEKHLRIFSLIGF